MTGSLFFLNKMETLMANDKVENRGRKVNPDSARQKKLAEQKAKVEAGIVVKRGRPAGTKNVDVSEVLKSIDI